MLRCLVDIQRHAECQPPLTLASRRRVACADRRGGGVNEMPEGEQAGTVPGPEQRKILGFDRKTFIAIAGLGSALAIFIGAVNCTNTKNHKIWEGLKIEEHDRSEAECEPLIRGVRVAYSRDETVSFP